MKKTTSCPDEEVLGASLEGSLSGTEEALLKKHGAGCIRCRQSFETIRRLSQTAGEVPYEHIPVRLVKAVLALPSEHRTSFDIAVKVMSDALKVLFCSDRMRMTMLPAGTPVRRMKDLGPNTVVFARSIGSREFEVRVEKIAAGTCNIQVLQKQPADRRGVLRAELWSGGRELMSETFERDYVLFEDVSLGDYTVRIRENNSAQGEITIKIM